MVGVMKKSACSWKMRCRPLRARLTKKELIPVHMRAEQFVGAGGAWLDATANVRQGRASVPASVRATTIATSTVNAIRSCAALDMQATTNEAPYRGAQFVASKLPSRADWDSLDLP